MSAKCNLPDVANGSMTDAKLPISKYFLVPLRIGL
jgi:hypothetical protein